MKVLAVDDTITYRKIVSDILKENKQVGNVLTAANGKIALDKVKHYSPDLVFLDVEMPELDGIETLKEIKQRWPHVGVIMLSSRSEEDADLTIKALELGAFDFIPKPNSAKSFAESISVLEKDLISRISAFARHLSVANAIRGRLNHLDRHTRDSRRDAAAGTTKGRRLIKKEIVAIGISTGGPVALAQVIPKFPENMRVPVVIVQHMPEKFTKSLADSLNEKSKVIVKEAEDGELLRKGTVYIAPGGKQMSIRKSLAKHRIKIADDPPENNCRPSVDYLFRSVAMLYGAKALGIIMTGMGADGAEGIKYIYSRGGFCIAQNEQSSIVFGMPDAAIKTGKINKIVSLSDMASIFSSLTSYTSDILSTNRPK